MLCLVWEWVGRWEWGKGKERERERGDPKRKENKISMWRALTISNNMDTSCAYIGSSTDYLTDWA